MSGQELLCSSLEHCHEDKLAEITERHHIEYYKENRALQDKFEREYLSLNSKLQDKNKDLEKQKHLLHESKVQRRKEVFLFFQIFVLILYLRVKRQVLALKLVLEHPLFLRIFNPMSLHNFRKLIIVTML